MITRRKFIERLGLGVGAPILAPIAATLFDEAQGFAQVGTRKRAIFFLIGDSFHYEYVFTPKEFSGDLSVPVLNAPTTYTWPGFVKALEPYRKRMMLVDGLANQLRRSQHSGGYGALSGMTSPNDASNEYGGPPGGITIDQYAANRLGATTRVKSLLFGVNKYNVTSVSFAAGVGKPEPQYVDPQLMWNRVFAGITAPGTGGTPGEDKEVVRAALLMDTLRTDVGRMQRQLAGVEKRKLDHYLAAIDDYDNRVKMQKPVECKVPGAPAASTDHAAKLEAMVDIATLALVCGITNVVGVGAGTGMSHKMMVFPSIGHENAAGGPRSIETHNKMAGHILKMVKALEGIREGDRTAFDNSLIMYTSDNGEDHHSRKARWPFYVVGNAGGKLKADGRFVRFPMKGKPGWRSMSDFFCTVTHALGIPTDTFGMGGVEPVKGPLNELLG